MADIDANGRADGMLALKLNSIYALPRDRHTDIGASPPYSITLALLDTSMNEDGAMIPEETYYLSLSRGEDGVIRPVYRYEDAEGNVVRERQIESINGGKCAGCLDQIYVQYRPWGVWGPNCIHLVLG